MPTILSRCQEIKFFYNGKYEVSQEEQKVLQDLQKIMNSDLAEKFNYAKKVNLENGNFGKILTVLQKCLRQMLLAKIGSINFKGQGYSILKLKKNLRLIENLSHQSDITNINNKLALEVLLMEM